MKKRWHGFLFVWLAAAASAASGGGLVGGRFFTEPRRVYVNQPFELQCEIAVTPGTELEDFRLSGLPADPALEFDGPLRPLSRSDGLSGRRPVTLLRYAIGARSSRPLSLDAAPALSCQIVERRRVGFGFFSSWVARPVREALRPFTLRVLPLPAEGRPEAFGGAVGQFSLEGSLSRSEVRPGDLVTLSLTLKGAGWMGGGGVPRPAASPHFKVYPAKEVLGGPLRKKTEQVWIPADTNATEIGAVSFAFFNPKTERYELRTAGPFRLTFTDASAAATNSGVKVIGEKWRAEGRGAGGLPPGTVSLARVNRSVRHFRPLLIAAGGLVLGLFCLFALYGPRRRLIAALAAAALAAAGAALGWMDRLRRPEGAGVITLRERREARLAPSARSARLFTLPPGTEARVLETADGWARVDADGLRGWIERPGENDGGEP